MRNTSLSYTYKDGIRRININSTNDLFAYAYAQELHYNYGILSLKNIVSDQEPPKCSRVENCYIEELAESINSQPTECYGIFNGERSRLRDEIPTYIPPTTEKTTTFTIVYRISMDNDIEPITTQVEAENRNAAMKIVRDHVKKNFDFAPKRIIISCRESL